MDTYTKNLIVKAIIQVFVLIFTVVYLLVGCVRLPSEVAKLDGMEYNIANSVEECKDNCINYCIFKQANGVPVITIYHSYQYGEISNMKEILHYIITSPEGVAIGLKEDDLDYYVQEWYVLNMAHLCPLDAQLLIGGNVDDIVQRTEHADLNTDDSHAKLYQEIFAFLRKKI